MARTISFVRIPTGSHRVPIFGRGRFSELPLTQTKSPVITNLTWDLYQRAGIALLFLRLVTTKEPVFEMLKGL
jgi:hypothetical protein